MRLFLDTANLEEIKKAAALGVISGVTTNPSLVAKEEGGFHEMIQKITAVIPGPVSAEVMGTTADKMVEEAKVLARINENVVIKIPMTAEGLQAVNILSHEGIKTNVTLIYSVNQALLAARAGATYVSPFVGRLDDISVEGLDLIRDIAEVFAIHDLSAQIIAASIRHPMHVVGAAKAGAHIATIPFKILMQMIEHPMTTAGIQRFLADWEKAHKG